MIWVIEYMCCAFLVLTGLIIIHWGRWQWRRWKTRRRAKNAANAWMGWFVGGYHLLFGILKTIYITMDLFV